jgi:leucyl aminopeptidase
MPAMKARFAAPSLPQSGTLLLLAGEGPALAPLGQEADKASGGHVARAMAAAKFEGKKDQSIEVIAPGDTKLDRIIVLGAGDIGKLQPRDLELLGGTAAGLLQSAKATEAAVAAELPGDPSVKPGEIAALLASGLRLRSYGFDGYKTKKKDNGAELKQVSLLTSAAGPARKAFQAFDAVADGVHMARDLVNEPANTLYPEEFARRAKELEKLGVKVEILDPKQMGKIGMRALLGVGLGSARPPRVAVMRWDGGKRGDKPVAFVGKGVTFDTGGISIKPSSGMEDMKGDMAGAACVTGLMAALAKRKAKVNAVGIIGLVENMPDGEAQRPGDIVKSLSGQTIVVINTDAEGRLVLADLLWYVQDKFKPQFMVDLATLTGAVLVALGKEHAGLFSNNDELSERLTAAGQATGERIWRLPLASEYDKLIDSDFADMKNTGGRNAGSITAAQFLQRFVNDTPWAHLDVAGVAMDSPKTAISQSWASGWGVRLLDRLVADHYES